MSGQYSVPSRTSRIDTVSDGVRRYLFESLAGTADQAIAITDVIDRITLNSTTGTKVISTTSAREGQRVTIVCTVRSGGAYTLACTTSAGAQTATLDAVNEIVVVERINGVWVVVWTQGTTYA